MAIIINEKGELRSDAGKLVRRVSDDAVFRAVLVGKGRSTEGWEETDYAPVAETCEEPKTEDWVELLKRSVDLDAVLSDEKEAAQERYRGMWREKAQWRSFIGKRLEAGKKVYYRGDLYKTLQTIDPVLAIYPPSVSTAALYRRLDGEHKGTEDDPIPYPHDGNMAVETGKVYSEGGKKYRALRDSGNALYCPLYAVVDNYVRLVDDGGNDETKREG